MYSSEDDDGIRSASLAHHLLSPDRSPALAWVMRNCDSAM